MNNLRELKTKKLDISPLFKVISLSEKHHCREKSNVYVNICYNGLDDLRTPTGLYIAAPGPAYKYAWLRDSLYCSYPSLYTQFRQTNDDTFTHTLHAILDRMKIEETRIENFIEKNGEVEACERIHPKFCAYSLKDVLKGKNEWGYIQNDAIGQILFNISLGIKSGRQNILRDKKDFQILQKLIKYCCISYYKDWDNGVWEEQIKLNTSSIVPCLAGLISIKSIIPQLHKIADIKKIDLNMDFMFSEKLDEFIKKGKDVLFKIFTQQNSKELNPQESPYFEQYPHLQRTYDLALLSLIYPYGIADIDFAIKIVQGIENNLLRERGVVRYIGDIYYNRAIHYNKNDFDKYPDGINDNIKYHEKYGTKFSHKNPILGNEAEWCMGIPWLAICNKVISDNIFSNFNKSEDIEKASLFSEKAKSYLEKSESIMLDKGLPELYFSGTNVPNVNNPLGWANSMYIVAYMHVNNYIPKQLQTKLVPNLWNFLKN